MNNDGYYIYLCNKIDLYGMESLTDSEQAYYNMINAE